MANVTGYGSGSNANVTGNNGSPMDPQDLRRRAQQDPGFFQQLMNSLGLGNLFGSGGVSQPGVQVTGDTSGTTRQGFNITQGAGAGGSTQVTGSGATTANAGVNTAAGANAAPGTGGGASSIPPMGAAGGGGGSGRPPVTGAGASASPPGGNSGPGINLAGMRDQARASQLGQSVLQNTGRTTLRGAGLALAGKYGPLIGGGLALAQGDVLGAAGTVAGGLLGGAVGGPVGSIIGATIGGGATKALAGGAAKAVEAVTGAKREAGQSGVFGGSIPGLTTGDLQAAEALRSGNVKTAQEMLPLYQQYRGVDMQNQMQLNQQLGQLTGALNRQMYAAQLAGGAQQQAGQTVRDILASSNPYAASVFRAG